MSHCARSTTVTLRPRGSPTGMPLEDPGLGGMDNSTEGADCRTTKPAATPQLPPRRTRRCVHGDSTSQAEYAGSIPVIGSTVTSGNTDNDIRQSAGQHPILAGFDNTTQPLLL